MGEGRGHQLRCAVYTRKSTEEGLDQEFNSLDAQREAGEAYVLSQRHEGWTLVADRYDDGGYSGGNMERPALRRLLAEVQAGRVNVVVVYKVDRLTRSLADFAKIVEVLDAAGANFVSVTQSFNTTTSMGRLTLNVLLSFAQFEREVSAERVRDKIAASKKKGVWMGGAVPLGYDPKDRKLVINEEEAETVRHIFRRYLELGSVPALRADLRDAGIVTKRTLLKDGSIRGGNPFSRGALHWFLKNRIYRGDIVHKDKVYPGEHMAIVDEGLFDAVQAKLAENIGDKRNGNSCGHPSLLAGMIRDSVGRPMSPSHANKGSTRYRYYISNEAIDPAEQQLPIRLPAEALESAVVTAVAQRLDEHSRCLGSKVTAEEVDRASRELDHARGILATSRTAKRRAILASLNLHLVVHPDRIDASLQKAKIRELLHLPDEGPEASDRLEFEVPATLQRRGHEVKLRIDPRASHSGKADANLIRLVVRANLARQQLSNPEFANASQARREIARLARASYLAPDIVEAIFEGRAPANLQARRLERLGSLPICWQEQRRILGFA